MNTPSVCLVLGLAVITTTTLLSGCNKPAPTAADPPAAVSNVADVDVTSNVQTALLNDASLKDKSIAVVTLKGDVRLTGVLDNQAQIDSALRIARAAPGVHSIHDELTLGK